MIPNANILVFVFLNFILCMCAIQACTCMYSYVHTDGSDVINLLSLFRAAVVNLNKCWDFLIQYGRCVPWMNRERLMWTFCAFLKNCVFWLFSASLQTLCFSLSIASAWGSADTVMDRNGGLGQPCLVLILKTIFLTVLCLK